MTILHVLDHSLPVMSGYSTRSRNIVVFQQRAGLRPVVLTSPKHGASRLEVEPVDGIPHYRTRPLGWPAERVPLAGELALMLRLTARILRVAKREGVRIIHAHSPLLNGLPALWAGRRLGVPVVYEARAFWEDAAVDHGTTTEGSARYRLTRALETRVFRRATRVVTIANAMREELIARGVPSARIVVVPNGVDADWFRPMERPAEVGARLGLDGGLVVGFIGSFYHYEGLRFLLQALPAVRERVPGLKLLLVGGGPEEAALRQAAVPLNGAVIFTGQVPYAQVRGFYALTDVFVCPRRRMRLTELVTPLKPLEAMAMARPVLASDVGGLVELIRHGETGLLFPAECQSAFVEQMSALARDPGLRQHLGVKARDAVLAERTWPAIVRRYVDLYGAVTGQAVAPASRD